MAELEGLGPVSYHQVRRNLFIVISTVLGVALMLFSVTPRAASSQDAQSQGASQGAVPQSLHEKMHRLQTLMQQKSQEGADMSPVTELMQGFQLLMQQQRFSEAEALVDRALKVAGELRPADTAQLAVPPPWLQETMRHVKKPTPDNPDYLVYQFMGDLTHPYEPESQVEKLQAEFGPQKRGQSKYIGFAFFIQDMNDDGASLRQQIETMLALAEKYEMPVFFHLEGALFWDRRTDELSKNPDAVEWTAFPSPGQKTGPAFKQTWFDWGQPEARSAPPPCFESPLFRADVEERLGQDIAAPIRAALDRWRSGPVDRSYLFAGITVGNEVMTPDYRTFKRRLERPRDSRTGVEMTDAEMVRGGYCSLYHRGYTADKVREIVRNRYGADDPGGKNTDAVITELLAGVVQDYCAFRAKILWDALAGSGPAQNRIYTHTNSLLRKEQTIAAAVNPYSRPGFTVVRNNVNIPDVLSQMRAAAGGDDTSIVPWGAVESYATVGQPGLIQTKEQYRVYLETLFGSGVKHVSLLEAPENPNNPFTVAAESAGVKSAIKEWLTN